jgi:D-glycero-D-manno-heptose 1,7-bisphosphate phosphatase
MKKLNIKSGAALFLDRDGVINRRIPGDYVKNPSEFQFLEGVPEAIKILNLYFDLVLVVTNQQGIGKGLFTREQLDYVHLNMKLELARKGALLHYVYYCPEMESNPNNCRKPRSMMAEWAKTDFPLIDFNNAVMAGDSATDIEFAENCGMQSVLIDTNPGESAKCQPDFTFFSLLEMAQNLIFRKFI